MDRGVVAAPGAFNALCGRAVAAQGFEAAYVSGGATSVAAGVPDVGILSFEAFTRVIREVAVASGLPILADADTGFGEEEMVRRTVVEYHHAGAAGLHIEDQVFPKRCGHLDGKSLIPTEQMQSKVAWAARAAADCSGGSFVVCARTDARSVDGLDGAIARARAYVEAGADMVFPEGLESAEEFRAFAEAVRGGGRPPYLLANMTEFGKTPQIALDRFGELGYDLVIYPVSTLRAAMGAVTRMLADLRQTGSVERHLDRMQTRDELYGLVGYRPGQPWDYPAPPGGGAPAGG